MMKKFIFIILCFSFAIPINAETINIEDAKKAIVETANAFYYKGEYIQQGNERLTYKNMKNAMRGEIFFKPEEATASNKFYTVCSTFAFMLYYNAFQDTNGNPYKIKGINPYKLETTSRYLIALNDNLKNPLGTYDEDMTEYYSGIMEYMGNEESKQTIQATLAEKFKMLEIGDVITYSYKIMDGNPYKHESYSHHTVIYYGKFNYGQTGEHDSIIESNGGTYSFKDKIDKYEKAGSIRISKSNTLPNRVFDNLDETKKYYIKVGILRPLDAIKKDSNIVISDAAKTRNKYPGLEFEIYPKGNRTQTVDIDEEIKYEIKIINNGTNTYNNVEITVPIPNNTKYISSGNGTFENNKIIFKVNVGSKETKIYSFNFKVNNDENLYNQFISTKMNIEGLIVKAKDVLIGKTFTNDEQKQIQERVLEAEEKIAEKPITIKNSSDYVKEIYEELNLSFDINTINASIWSTKEVRPADPYSQPVTESGGNQDHLYGTQTEYSLKAEKNNYLDMLVTGMYGGVYTLNQNKNNEDNKCRYLGEECIIDSKRVRYVEINDFIDGDILVINNRELKNEKGEVNPHDKDGEIHNLYLFVNEKFITFKDDNIVSIEDEEELKTMIGKLIGHDNFYVLRPSLLTKKKVVNLEEKPDGESTGSDKTPNNETPVNPEEGNEVENPNTGSSVSVISFFVLIVLSVIFLYIRKINYFKKI